ncbi:MAG: aspartate aminotransferase family protein [Geobacteraceae bacterium]|nr:aspartate aminotransferase family protein [Geobacteraceae bacterium]
MESSLDIMQRAARVFTPALHVYYPLPVVRGEGVRVYAADGRSWLDFSSGLAVLALGHNHPRVVTAVKMQLENLIHTGGVYFNETTVTAAEKLVSITPVGLDMLFFSNSGAEAVEGALKVARYVTGRQGIVSFTGAFHGRTLGALSVTTSSAAYRKKYHPLLPSVYQAPYPYCFRCPFQRKPDTCGLCCLQALDETLKHRITADEVAAVIIEPFLGEGGYIPAPAAFLVALRELCTRHGILLIFDEVQSGMGRTGHWFASEVSGVVPDILTVAKGIASGFPLSAVVARKEIMELWPSGAHGTTFGGNPVSCAACSATIDVIQDEALLAKTSSRGATVLDRLRGLAEKYPVIGDVRGHGLMIGIEFVMPDGSPDHVSCEAVLRHCLENGLILINCGIERNVIRFIPPLVTTDQEFEAALGIFHDALRRLL